MIPVAMELGCALRLVWDGDGEVVVPGVRGIRWRWDGHGEFGQCAVAALPTLFGPQRRRKMGGGGPELSFPTWLALGPPMKSGGNCWLLVSLSLSAVAAAAEPDKCVLNLACACLQHM